MTLNNPAEKFIPEPELPPQKGEMEIDLASARDQVAKLEKKAQAEFTGPEVIVDEEYAKEIQGTEESAELKRISRELTQIAEQKKSIFSRFKNVVDSVRARLAGFKGEEASLYKEGLDEARAAEANKPVKLSKEDRASFAHGKKEAGAVIKEQKKEEKTIYKKFKKDQPRLKEEAALTDRIKRNKAELLEQYGTEEPEIDLAEDQSETPKTPGTIIEMEAPYEGEEEESAAPAKVIKMEAPYEVEKNEKNLNTIARRFLDQQMTPQQFHDYLLFESSLKLTPDYLVKHRAERKHLEAQLSAQGGSAWGGKKDKITIEQFSRNLPQPAEYAEAKKIKERVRYRERKLDEIIDAFTSTSLSLEEISRQLLESPLRLTAEQLDKDAQTRHYLERGLTKKGHTLEQLKQALPKPKEYQE